MRRPLALASALSCLLAGCLTPPAVPPAGVSVLDPDRAELPPGSQLVELEIEDGVQIRGIFSPSDDGSPVILHLIEAGGSVTGDLFYLPDGDPPIIVDPGPRTVLWHYGDRGYASLMVDYEGVGASDGERSPTHLGRDARAAFDEAVLRAGGADRVIVRATSLGSLACAELIEGGARPAGIVLVAPVLPGTVVDHLSAEVYGGFVSAMGALVFGDVVDADPLIGFGPGAPPLAVFAAPEDELLPPADAARLRQAVTAGGGSWIEEGGDAFVQTGMPLEHHVRLALASRHPLPGELDAVGGWVPSAPAVQSRLARVLQSLAQAETVLFELGSPARAQLEALLTLRLHDAPEVVAAAALTSNETAANAALLDSLRFVPGWVEGMDLGARVRRLDLADPAGPLPATTLISATAILAAWRDGGQPVRPLDEVVALARGIGAPGLTGARRTIEQGKGRYVADLRRSVFQPARFPDLPDEDAARRALRILLRAAGYEDRLVEASDGKRWVEVFEGDERRLLDPALVLEK